MSALEVAQRSAPAGSIPSLNRTVLLLVGGLALALAPGVGDAVPPVVF